MKNRRTNFRARTGAIALFAISLASWSLGIARADLLIGSNRTDAVPQFNQDTGELIGEFVTSGSGGLSRPGGLASGRDGNLYVSSNATHSILRYSGVDGTFIDEFVPPGSGGLNKPSA